ncbi:MAG: hypothetical protein CMC08_00395 [Flavobacteriaceae bacterium]|nr:hypothetical protein [Flavobacteriaceae bacterium]|tara:strand:+ start:100 stop:336 length:237 start_codon:yes stop_codon:yes gene_type:complete
MKNTERKGLLALVGIGLGALAFFGYKRMPKQRKDQLKAKVNETTAKIRETGKEVKDSIANSYQNAKGETQTQVNDLTS